MDTVGIAVPNMYEGEIEDDEVSPAEQVRLTVPNTDDPTLPVWTFRMWVLGLLSCVLLSFLNQFFALRNEPLIITHIAAQLATLPIGRFMASTLPTAKFRLPGSGSREFSLNPGPFNMKEHALISIFANAGSAFGNGTANGVKIVTIIIAFYQREISFFTGWLLVVTTQVLGYGWAGLLRKYVVEPVNMWWPTTLAQISIFRTLHEKESEDAKWYMSRFKFFAIVAACSFLWYLFPGYFFQSLKTISWVCWAFPKSVTAQQIGSGVRGLGLGALTLDWATVSSFLDSPLISPFFVIANTCVGYVTVVYIVIPILYWGFNVYNAKSFPLFSSDLFTAQGDWYDISALVNDKFELDEAEYDKQGGIHLSTAFIFLSYGFGLATVASTISHVALFHGREIYNQFRASSNERVDIHTRLMRKYKDIPSWWFYILLFVTMIASLALCFFMKEEVQMPYWGLLLAAAFAFIFTLPISIIAATTSMTPGLNILTDYITSSIYPGKPIAYVCFKAYGFMSISQTISFLNDFKLGNYMKIPPRSMFFVQLLGTIVAVTTNMIVGWWLLHSVDHICDWDLLPDNSPWTCPNDRVFFAESVIWGLVGPEKIFGPALKWFVLGVLGPVVVWLLHKAFPSQTWITLINFPLLFGATTQMPPATSINYTSWILVGTIFNFFIFRYRKKWWQRYNYVLSAALETGVAFMGAFLFFTVGLANKNVSWWGTKNPEHCDLATCPTAKGITVEGCPTF